MSCCIRAQNNCKGEKRHRKPPMLLAVDWEKARDQLLYASPACPTRAVGVPQNAIYAWWDLSGALSGFWPCDFPPVDTQRPLYVGDAPSGLEARISDMHLATTRMSGLRRSLAALLVRELGLLPGITAVGRGKVIMDDLCEARLTSWMVQNLYLTWVLTNDWSAIEKLVIADLCSPLNDKHATKSKYRKLMRIVRKELCRAAARDAPSGDRCSSRLWQPSSASLRGGT